MTRVETSPGGGRQGLDATGGGPPTQKVGIPVVVTVVEAPACHLCEDAKSSPGSPGAVLSDDRPRGVDQRRARSALMQAHRAPMSPLVLLDGAYFSSGRLPRRKLEKRLAKAQGGVSNGQ